MVGEKEKLKEKRYNSLYLDIAERISHMSYAKRLKVGSVIVKENNIISFGWNGMPSGFDNNCEDILPDNMTLKTKPEVLHSEQNSLMKLAKSTNSSEGSVMYITHAPCIECAKLIYQSGINSVYYRNIYRSSDGVEFLKKCNIHVEKV